MRLPQTSFLCTWCLLHFVRKAIKAYAAMKATRPGCEILVNLVTWGADWVWSVVAVVVEDKQREFECLCAYEVSAHNSMYPVFIMHVCSRRHKYERQTGNMIRYKIRENGTNVDDFGLEVRFRRCKHTHVELSKAA